MAKTVIIEEPGGPEVLKLVDREVGEPGKGEIRIRHEACGLNYIDVYQRTGLYKMELPHALGMEAAGVVEAVGEGVTHLEARRPRRLCRGASGRLFRGAGDARRAGLPAARGDLLRGGRGDDAQGHDGAVPLPPHDAPRAAATRCCSTPRRAASASSPANGRGPRASG